MNNYTEELKRILKNSELIAESLNSSDINSIHFLMSLLKNSNSLTPVLEKHKIDYEEIKNFLPNKNEPTKYLFYSKELLSSIEGVILSLENIDDEITLNLLLNEILSNKNTLCYKALIKTNTDIENLKKDIKTTNTISSNSILKSIGRNLNELAIKKEFDPVIGREKEITRIIEVLKRKNKNNPLLLGEAGVGKTSVVEELASRITKNLVPDFLKGKTIYEVNLSSVIAGTKYRGEFEEKLTKLINELETNNNLILFIDEIHTLVGAGGAEGAIDASNILKPALARGKLSLIGATTLKEYTSSIEKDKALDRRFEPLLINEPNYDETLYILKKIKPNYEKYHNVKIPNNIIELTAKLSDKYIKNRNNPDKSIDILDEICAITSLVEKKTTNTKIENKIISLTEKKNKCILENNLTKALSLKKEITSLESIQKKNNTLNIKNTVTKSILKEVLETKTNSNIFELSNPSYFTDLNNYLKLNIYEQDHIIDNITKKLICFTKNNNKLPLTISLKGPTGTGKTYLVKTLSKYLKTHLITLNMKDYVTSTSITKLIGTTAGYVGYDEKNTPFESLKHHPISIILLEDYNYTHPSIKALFDTISTTGKLTLNNNEIINFENTIIIKTTKEESNHSIGFIEKPNKQNTLTFNSLSVCSIKKIITKQNNTLTDEQINRIIEKSNYLEQNAKQLLNLINENLVNINEVIPNL